MESIAMFLEWASPMSSVRETAGSRTEPSPPTKEDLLNGLFNRALSSAADVQKAYWYMDSMFGGKPFKMTVYGYGDRPLDHFLIDEPGDFRYAVIECGKYDEPIDRVEFA